MGESVQYRPRRAASPETDASEAPDGLTQPPSARHAAPGEPVPAIELHGITKHFGDVVAVDHVDLTVPAGRVTGFLGPNGAGKTTTLRMLVGLAVPTEGSATFGDRPYRDLDQPMQRVGAALEANFHPGRTGRDHLRVFAPTAGADDARVDELLELVQLTAAGGRRVGGYSLGMRQRLALATALLGDPDYLILDEPANGLDPEGIRWLRGFLKGYAASGRVVLVSSHMLGEVAATADDVAVIGHGRLLRHAPIDEINVAEPTSRLRSANLRGTADALAADGFTVSPAHDVHGPYVRVHTADTAAVGEALLRHQIAVVELAPERINLEESFFRMIEQEAS